MTKSETNVSAQHLARVAARLFAERGYDATSVREIVEAAGVTKPTLYYYFGSKEGLAQALLTEPMRRLVELIQARIDAGGDPVRTLEGIVEAHFAFCREDPDRTRLIYAVFFGPLGSTALSKLGCYGEATHDLCFEALRRAGEAGVIDLDRVESANMALRGRIIIHTMDFLYRGGELAPDLATRVVDDLLRGFGGPMAPRHPSRTEREGKRS